MCRAPFHVLLGLERHPRLRMAAISFALSLQLAQLQ
jgi:hypothetical protein